MAARFDPTEITLAEVPGSDLKKLVLGDLTFIDSSGIRWTAPEGTLTDGASVPRLALSISDGRFDAAFLKAAVVHDAYCQSDNMSRNPPFQSRSWRATHRMFYEACRAGGTPWKRARILFAAVWWGGPRWGDPVAQAAQAPPDLARIGLSATKHWIETDEPDLDAIEADVGNREIQVVQIHALQMQAIRAMVQGNSDSALSSLLAADTDIASGLAAAPNDLMYLNLQAYQHKNWAMLRPDDRDDRLALAETLFQNVIASEPNDPGALNGLGSVAMLRGRLAEAKTMIRKALDIEPGYAAALHDLQQIEDYEHRIGTD